MRFLLESAAILSGLIAVIIGLCREKYWLAVLGGVFVVSVFAGMFALYRAAQ